MSRTIIAAAAVLVVSLCCPGARPGALHAFAQMSQNVPAILWAAFVALAFLLTAEAMHRVTDLPRSLMLLIFAPIDAYCAMVPGNVAPFAVASLAAAMLALAGGRPRLAAWALLPSLCVPAVGVAPLLALFVCLPRARRPIAFGVLGIVALGIGSLLAAGPLAAFERLGASIPQHTLNALSNPSQLSAAALLHAIGVPDRIAVTAGALAYAATIAFAIAAARRLSLRGALDPLVLAAPAAFALVGGLFIDVSLLPIVFPAALVAYSRVGGRLKAAIGAALIIVAVPWLSGLTFALGVPCVALLAGLLASSLLGVSSRTSIFVGIVAAGCAYALELGIALGAPSPALDRAMLAVARLPAWLAIATIVVAVGLTAYGRYFKALDRRTIRFGIRTTSHEW